VCGRTGRDGEAWSVITVDGWGGGPWLVVGHVECIELVVAHMVETHGAAMESRCGEEGPGAA